MSAVRITELDQTLCASSIPLLRGLMLSSEGNIPVFLPDVIWYHNG